MEQRATGQFLSVQGPAGIVVSIAGWMLDPVICAGMTIGAPRVDLAALVELERLLIGTANPAHSRSDVAIVREEGNEVSQIAGGGAESWAILASLVNTAKLHELDPQAYLADVLERIVSGRTKSHQLHELLAWNWKAAQARITQAAA